MFDVGFSELVLLAIVALVVLGPEKLPHAARIAGAWVGRIRRTVSTMQAEIEREVSLQEMKSRLEKDFGHIGGNDVLRQLNEERQELQASLHDADAEMRRALAETTADREDSGSTLAQAAQPLETVQVDGEKAYREWLEAQKQKHSTPSDQTPAS